MKLREKCHLASCKFSEGTFFVGVCLSHNMTENMAPLMFFSASKLKISIYT
jgi:hypothetical protein